MFATSHILRGALGVSLACFVTAASAQMAYDPMRPTPNPLMPVNPLMPATSEESTTESASAEVLPNPEFGNLPDAEGVEETFYQCVACHSTAIILQQSLTDARWDYLWTWMIEEQGMFEPEDEIRDEILTYLKTHFSSER
ncbi:cytochrome C-552 [Pararhodobacter oceanensis]|uniref:Cytochrome C-552 n=1 Tax=Pararhodobacter oceanensis TaxID=2172121 RepID=A0A2T8HPC7_9RHOB|nr:cytochrome C-552 [Pararhodobacter oceanensis]PVH27287.1 cytochrome C-552 [Pararhodobacter oceanensis]